MATKPERRKPSRGAHGFRKKLRGVEATQLADERQGDFVFREQASSLLGLKTQPGVRWS